MYISWTLYIYKISHIYTRKQYESDIIQDSEFEKKTQAAHDIGQEMLQILGVTMMNCVIRSEEEELEMEEKSDAGIKKRGGEFE